MNRKPKRPRLPQAVRAGSIAEEFFSSGGYAEKLKQYRAWQVWEQVVGPQIASHAKPLRIRDGILEVRVDQPIWMQQLRMMAPQILQKLNQELGEGLIRELFWKRGRMPDTPVETTAPERPPRSPLTETERAAIERELAALPEGEIRDALRRVRIRQAETEKGRKQ